MANKTIECPKCGAVNDAKSKFCKHCGSSLKVSKIKCAECGAFNDIDSIYCSECGNSLRPEKVKKVGSPASEIGKTLKNVDSKSMIKNVAIVVAFIAIILAFIGIFGGVAKTTLQYPGRISTVQTTSSLSYFFKNCWDNLKNYKEMLTPDKLDEAYGQIVIRTIVHFVSYIVAFVGMISLVLYSAYCAYKSSTYKVGMPITKISKILLIVVAPFLMLTSFFTFSSQSTTYSESYSFSTTYGWGTIMLIISLFFAFLAYSIFEFAETSKEKRMPFFLSKFAVLLMLFIVIFGFSPTVRSSNGSASIASSVFNEFFSALTVTTGQEVFGLAMSGGTKALFVISIILIFLVMISVLTSIGAKQTKNCLISCASILGLSIIAGILVNRAMNNFAQDLKSTISGLDALAPSFIVDIVLGTIATISVIFASALDNRIKQN